MLHTATAELVGGNVMSNAGKIERILEVAKAHRDALREKFEQINELIDTFETLKSKISSEMFEQIMEKTEFPDLDRNLLTAERMASGITAKTPTKELSPESIVRQSRDLLLRLGRPLKRGQLVRELEAQGLSLPGKDKNKNLGTILWRHPGDFVSLEGLGYWVRGVPLDGVYDPAEVEKKEQETAYRRYVETRFEIERIQADQTAQSAGQRAALTLIQGELESRYPSFPDRWQADPFR